MRRVAIVSAALGAGGFALGAQLPVLAASVGPQTALAMTSPLALPAGLEFLADPTLVFGLLLLGLLGIGVELVHPGALFPGIVGVLAGAAAVVGLAALPLNPIGLVVVGAAVALFILDIPVPSHGAVSSLGIVAAIVGGWLLFRGPGVNLIALLGLPLGMGALWVAASGRALAVRHRPFPQTPNELLGMTGVIRERVAPVGLAEVGGELWRAVARDDSALEVGSVVEVLAQDGFTIIVRLTGLPAPSISSRPAEAAARDR